MSKSYIKHGMSKTYFYKKYYRILDRCNNKNNKDYSHYGGRGIKCLWKSFEEFRDDMHESYERGLEIDRINNNGNYCKKNCKWSTRKEQTRNTRRNHFVEYNGKIKCLSELAEIYNINNRTLSRRIQNGWSINNAINIPIPVQSKIIKIKYHKKMMTIPKVAVELNMTPENLRSRIKKWGIKKAITYKKQGDGKFITQKTYKFNGKIKSLTEWSDILGIKYCTLWNRLNRLNLSINETFTKKL